MNPTTAILLAAGMGTRLGLDGAKCLLRFDDRSLLARHLELLEQAGVRDVGVVVGHDAGAVAEEAERHRGTLDLRIVENPAYEEGSVVSLWCGRHLDTRGHDVLVMDADVLYDHRLLDRLVYSKHASCFLLDLDLEPGEEPVKLCIRDGHPVELRKQVSADVLASCTQVGESVGFFRLAPDAARELMQIAESYVEERRVHEPHEEAVRDLLRAAPERFGFEDVTGLPWIEIDFPEDVSRAHAAVLPRLAVPAP